MAIANRRLIAALRETARTLELDHVRYKWSSFSHCNCGHLAQTITRLEPATIREAAFGHEGDWGAQARALAPPAATGHAIVGVVDYGDRPALDEGAYVPEDHGACAATGTPMREVLARMAAYGLEPEDAGHLERLSDPRVRRRLGMHTVDFRYSDRQNVIAYLDAWAALLEDELLPESNDHYALAAE